jgi:hypothetical protein
MNRAQKINYACLNSAKKKGNYSSFGGLNKSKIILYLITTFVLLTGFYYVIF